MVDWPLLRDILPAVCPAKLPSDFDVLLLWLKARGPVSINTAWDAVVSRDTTWLTDRYRKRVRKEAVAQNAQPDYSMHYHPQRGRFGSRNLYELLDFSPEDLQVLAEDGIEWFEIRTLSTASDRTQQLSTSRFYEMRHINGVAFPVRAAFEKLLALPEDVEISKPLGRLVLKLTRSLEQLHRSPYKMEKIISYALGRDRYITLHNRLVNVKALTIKDQIISIVFGLERNEPAHLFLKRLSQAS
jgi:hypothetical protein